MPRGTFTPGPYRVRRSGLKRLRNVTHYVETADGRYGIAECHFIEVDNAANARLLAAAPELLAACLAIQKAASECDTEEKFGERVTDTLGDLNAAIRKATT